MLHTRQTLAWLTCATLTAGAFALCDEVPTSKQNPPIRCGVMQVSTEPIAVDPQAASRPIDLAICLDTSGSMSGLINAAKQKLWAVVNDLALAEPAPRLRVALLTFGNDGHNPENGWVEVQTDFTEDLDLVSEKLFALSTNGGTEYVGRVLHYAHQLDWSSSAGGLKIAIVAGNESADQDEEMPNSEVCKKLITDGVIVNSIYCGPAQDNIAPGWKQVALLADGQFASIDKDHGTVVVETPFDEQLATLSTSLNETYIPIGEAGWRGMSNQEAQDSNAATLNTAAAAQRAQTKASAMYKCSWDLVDACRLGEIELTEVKREDLPEQFRDKTDEQLQQIMDEKLAQRETIQKEIAELNRLRAEYVEEEMKKQALDDSKAFDRVLRDAIRAQAVDKGFSFTDDSEKTTATIEPGC